MRAFAPALAALAGCGAIAIDVAQPATVDGAGTVAPDFTLPSQLGDVSLRAALGHGPVLLVFYRGFW